MVKQTSEVLYSLNDTGKCNTGFFVIVEALLDPNTVIPVLYYLANSLPLIINGFPKKKR